MKEKLRIAIAGLGGRGRYAYMPQLKKYSEVAKIVAIADIDPLKLKAVADEYNIPEDMCFSSAEELLEEDRLSDILFICTQDKDHYRHAVKAMEKGYHLLLEKPISPDLNECKEILETSHKYDRQVTVCHVLRYTSFYKKVKELVDSGVLGEIVHVNAVENVGYWHQSHSFVRGNWRNSAESSPMILAKSCHDMDILLWITSKNCKRVSSYGNRLFFRSEKAPKGAAKRCLDGCEYKEKCPYDAEKIYIENPATGIKNGHTTWPVNILDMNPTVESVTHALKEGPYGRCVFHCDNDVVDHQNVNLEMEDGSTISFTMCAFSSKISREIKVMGTSGELSGDTKSNKIKLNVYGKEEILIDLNQNDVELSGHGGGDRMIVSELINSFVNPSQGGTSLTSIDKSVQSHYVALAAEYSRLNHGISINVEEFVKTNTGSKKS